jgi:hypothetical protein
MILLSPLGNEIALTLALILGLLHVITDQGILCKPISKSLLA